MMRNNRIRKTILMAALASLITITGRLHASETAVFYQPMLDAYDAGRVEDARQLAKRFLDRSRRELETSTLDIDRDGASRRALDLVETLMEREAEFQPNVRFNNHNELVTSSQDVMRLAQEAVGRMTNPPDAVRQYHTRKLAAASRAWISSAGPRLPREQVQRVFQLYETQMREAGGPADVDTLLRNGAQPKRRNLQQAKPRASGIGNQDGTAIIAVIRNYYDGVMSGDAVKLAAATGSAPQAARLLIARKNDNFIRAKVRNVNTISLPALTGTHVADLLRARPDGLYDLYLQGIQTSVTDETGAAASRTVDKLFTLKRTVGRWTVVAPAQGGQQ